jgi:ribonuclease HII
LGTVAGVDDAGRGCVIGPLIVAGVLIDEGMIDDLRRLGVRDSKRLLPRKRETLATEIEARADCTYFEIPPWAIDHVVERNKRLRKLNYLEAMAMAKVIRDLQPDKVYVDASDVFPERFSQQISRVLKGGSTVVSEHQADNRYAVVSAASIIAKVRRDHIVAGLREVHGDFGSGYCSDRKTVAFLKSWFNRTDLCPSFIRSSWVTVKRLRGSI